MIDEEPFELHGQKRNLPATAKRILSDEMQGADFRAHYTATINQDVSLLYLLRVFARRCRRIKPLMVACLRGSAVFVLAQHIDLDSLLDQACRDCKDKAMSRTIPWGNTPKAVADRMVAKLTKDGAMERSDLQQSMRCPANEFYATLNRLVAEGKIRRIKPTNRYESCHIGNS